MIMNIQTAILAPVALALLLSALPLHGQVAGAPAFVDFQATVYNSLGTP